MIHFHCPACGSRFAVDEGLAGRIGRCKSCGERFTVPAVSAASKPPVDRAARGASGTHGGLRLTPLAAASRSSVTPVTGRPTNWIDAVTSQVGLAPISVEKMTPLRGKPSGLDEPSADGPYALASAPSLPAVEAAGGRPAGRVTRGYRHGMLSLQRLFRWLNETAYLLSVPFLMCMLLGLATESHSLLILGAWAVVLLNLGRIAAGLANLVVIPFRESLLRGVLFLIPPLTFVYLARHWSTVHRPVKRIVGPVVTIGLVALGLAVEPWLGGESGRDGAAHARTDSASAGREKTSGETRGAGSREALERLEDRASKALRSMEKPAAASD
jgi:predicted Zn finger-like uncharacterized protein